MAPSRSIMTIRPPSLKTEPAQFSCGKKASIAEEEITALI